MALIKCPECGKNVSDKAIKCPNCGCSLKRAIIQSNVIKCPECGAIIQKDSASCPNCGLPLTVNGQQPIRSTPPPMDTGQGVNYNNGDNNKDNTWIIGLVVLGIFIVGIVVFALFSGKHKTAVPTAYADSDTVVVDSCIDTTAVDTATSDYQDNNDNASYEDGTESQEQQGTDISEINFNCRGDMAGFPIEMNINIDNNKYISGIYKNVKYDVSMSLSGNQSDDGTMNITAKSGSSLFYFTLYKTDEYNIEGTGSDGSNSLRVHLHIE